MRAREERRKDKERKRRADQCHREWVEKKKQELKREREEKEMKRQEERLRASEVWEMKIKCAIVNSCTCITYRYYKNMCICI